MTKKTEDTLEKIKKEISELEKKIEMGKEDFLKKKLKYDVKLEYDYLNSGILKRTQNEIDFCMRKYSIERRSVMDSSMEYCVLFCDDNDLYQAEKDRINNLKGHIRKVFIIMVCPNKIILGENDASGIPDIIKVKSEVSLFSVGIIIEKNVKENLKLYIQILKYYCKIYGYKEEIEKSKNDLQKLYEMYMEQVEEELENNKKEIKKGIENEKKYIKKCNRILEELEAEYAAYAEKCKNKIAEEKYKAKNVGDFAADFLFRYSGIKEKISGILSDLRNNDCGDVFFEQSIKQCMDNIKNKPQIAFVGNFSSGKTSFINWLLAMEGEKQLRTSGKHNTALLTLIKSVPQEVPQEKVFIEFKKDKNTFRWNLLMTEADQEMADYYKGETGAIVKEIDDVNRQIIICLKSGKKKKIIQLQNINEEIIVKKGDILEKNQCLTSGINNRLEIKNDNFNIIFQNSAEYKEIYKAISEKKLVHVKIYMEYRNKRNILGDQNTTIDHEDSIVKLLSILQKFEEKYGKNVSYKEMNQDFVNQISGVVDEQKDIDIIYRIFIEGECHFNDFEEELNRDTWKKYCGTGDNGEEVYTESPKGYLFVDRVTYYLNKGFLEYAEIIDTPGMGSVSAEHDEITERYIRSHEGNLLVMLKIDKNAYAMGKRKFIKNIADIYEEKKLDRSHVFFVCNLWSKHYSKDELKELENICDKFYADIQKLGFLPDNFFVIDIQKMKMGHHHEKMFDKYMSDEKFKEIFEKSIASMGIKSQVKKCNNDIIDLFDSRRSYYGNLLDALNDNEEHKKHRITMYQTMKKNIEKIVLEPSFDKLFSKSNDVLMILEMMKQDFENYSKKEWNEYRDKLENKDDPENLDMMRKMCMDCYDENEIRDKIVDDYLDKMRRLKKIVKDDKIGESICKEINQKMKDVKRIGMSNFPFFDLKDKIVQCCKAYKSKIHFIKNRKISKQNGNDMQRYITLEIDKCRKENEDNFNRLHGEFDQIKKLIIMDIDRSLDGLEVVDDQEKKKDDYKKLIRKFTNMKKEWGKKILSDKRIQKIVITEYN